MQVVYYVFLSVRSVCANESISLYIWPRFLQFAWSFCHVPFATTYRGGWHVISVFVSIAFGTWHQGRSHPGCFHEGLSGVGGDKNRTLLIDTPAFRPVLSFFPVPLFGPSFSVLHSFTDRSSGGGTCTRRIYGDLCPIARHYYQRVITDWMNN